VSDITQLLERARSGDSTARDALYECVYPELKVLAGQRLRQTSTLTLLDASSLVHEVYLRLTRRRELRAENRHLFFAYASKIMRSVILDYVRERRALKRGGGQTVVTLQTGDAKSGSGGPDVEALDLALQALARIDERSHQIVEMRYFGGLSLDEIADALAVSPATVKRGWQRARAFLLESLQA
jgi:RNA polymerase sigma factor (TIGR02999 family)